MSWTVYPAIDLRGGRCVRLYQGDYNKETSYGDPIEVALRWQEEGAGWLHIVDLDGAKAGKPTQMAIVNEIIKSVDIPIQIGGGIRSIETVEQYLKIGVQRIILGTAALEDQELLKKALQLNSNAIAVGVDVRDGYVATSGWLNTSKVQAIEFGKMLVDIGVSTFIYTDISKDGTLTGPNSEATKEFAQKTKANVIASGGVSSKEDLIELRKFEADGVVGAVVGKALYTGKISLKEII